MFTCYAGTNTILIIKGVFTCYAGTNTILIIKGVLTCYTGSNTKLTIKGEFTCIMHYTGTNTKPTKRDCVQGRVCGIVLFFQNCTLEILVVCLFVCFERAGYGRKNNTG